MSIDKARLLIRVANEVENDEDRKALLRWADDILSGNQTILSEDEEHIIKLPIEIFRRYKGKTYNAH